MPTKVAVPSHIKIKKVSKAKAFLFSIVTDQGGQLQIIQEGQALKYDSWGRGPKSL